MGVWLGGVGLLLEGLLIDGGLFEWLVRIESMTIERLEESWLEHVSKSLSV